MSSPSCNMIESTARPSLTQGRIGSRVTFFPSRKNNGPVACGNLVQADHCVHLEYRRDVRRYECRPAVLSRGHTRFAADFLVHLSSGLRVYHKLLCSHFMETSSARTTMKDVETMLLEAGFLFRWITPEQLPAPMVTHNLRYLYHHSHGGSESAARKLRATLQKQPLRKATVEVMIAGGTAVQDLCQAIFMGHLRIDLTQRFSLQTLIEDGCHEDL